MTIDEQLIKLEVLRCMAILDNQWSILRRLEREIQDLRRQQEDDPHYQYVIMLINQLWSGAVIVQEVTLDL